MCARLLEEKRKLLVVADDQDVAEVAAFGLRMSDRWEAVVATSAAQAIEIAHAQSIVGIAIIVVQPSARLPRTVATLLSLSQQLGLPLFGLTPDVTVGEQFALLGVNVYCTPFDPIHMWHEVPQTAGHAVVD